MGSYDNPIGPVGPYDKHKKDDFDKEPPREKWKLAAYLLYLLKKAIESFEFQKGPSEKKTFEKEESSVRENLLRFSEALNLLKKEDRSQDSAFLSQFSESWNCILEDALRIKRDNLLREPFKNLIQKVQEYSNNQEHTLGYYLSEYAGQKWIPFPYMELIQKLHADTATLSEWAQMVGKLIQLLQDE